MGRLTSLPSSVVTDDSALGGAVIANSLRVSTTDSSYLIRTPSSAGNRRTFTISLWVKRSSMSGSAVFGAYISNSDRATLRFTSDFIEFQTSGYSVKTTATFRDTNSWYHIVCAIDTTQGTQSDRGKIYVNGVQQTLQSNNLPQNLDTSVNNNSVQTFGTRWIGSYNGGFDGYLAEINLIDGFQLDPTYFGYTEFQTGIWRPKAYVGSYGTNGVRLDFSDNSATTAVTLGKDRSGQGNDYTPTNLSVSAGAGNDSFPESPTAKKEFATLNSNLQTSSSTEYRQGNLAFYTSGSSTVQTRANMSRSSGKWYAEFTLTTFTVRSGSYPYVGVAQAENFSNTWTGESGTAYQSQGGIWRNNGQLESGYATYTQGDVISVAINLDSSPPQVWWAKNGSYIRSGANPATFTAGINIEPSSPSGTYTFTASLFANPGQWDANFGQRPFAHSIPAGYKTLHTDNFPINTPTIIRPQKHFDVITYSGNGSSPRRIGGLEFAPDFVWLKNRNSTNWHRWQDSVNGANNTLYSNSSNAQAPNESNGHLDAFTHDGFIVDDASGAAVNGSSNTFVAWCWKGGGAPTTTNSASVGSVPTAGSVKIDGANATSALAGTIYPNKMSVNTTAGFSISQYTATGGSSTLAHGLTKRPDMTIVKDTGTGTDWIVYTKVFDGSNDYIILNNNTQKGNSGLPGVTDTVFSWGSNSSYSNTSGRTYIMYNWTSIPGYSKIGKYNALGSADGAYVDLGFRPAFILIRPTNNFGGSDQNYSTWGLWDSTRSATNPVTYAGMLTANMNSPEQVRGNGSNDGALVAFDILGTGFKIRGSSYEVGYSGPYFYMAFAEQPGESPYHTDTNAG